MKRTLLILLAVLMLAACSSASTPTASPAANPTAVPTESIDQRIAALLAQMTLAEKIGQMTQVEKGSIAPRDVTRYFIGSVLSGGGGSPASNTPEDWLAMVNGYQEAALATRLGIPLLYSVDAVHGHAATAVPPLPTWACTTCWIRATRPSARRRCAPFICRPTQPP